MLGPLLFAQAATAPARSFSPPVWLEWFYVWGEPSITDGRPWGGLMTWSKVVGLYCLLAWAVGWLLASSRSDTVGRKSHPVKLYLVVAALATGVLAAALGVINETGRYRFAPIGGLLPSNWLILISGLIAAGLVEFQLWSVFARRRATADLLCFVAMHLAFLAGFVIARQRIDLFLAYVKSLGVQVGPSQTPDWRVVGGRIGASYMGLIVLVRVAFLMVGEALALRWRRIYSIAWESIVEANRSNRAPWVVIGVFVVILAFTHWFLRTSGERDAELSRLFVGTLTLLCSLLLSVMVGFIAPRSMPRDIQSQVIYTIVSKPVRRLELIWGRLLGYMVLVTFLLVLFGGISLAYLDRNVGVRITQARAEAAKYRTSKPDYAKQLDAQADQLQTRMSARVPIKGSLVFVDAKNANHQKGIDVGQEQDVRSFVEGATESRAAWRFDLIRDPANPARLINTLIPVEALLNPDSIEGLQDRLYNLKDEQQAVDQQKGDRAVKAADAGRMASESKARADEIARLEAELKDLKDREATITRAAASLPRESRGEKLAEARALHSSPIPIEMSFTVYRTTKGVVGEPVLASLTATNPRGAPPFRDLFPIREYYTIKRSLPARVLVGSHGRLNISVRCETANQYLGMAENDLHILASQGGFRLNYMKGLFGIWLQAMVLTAIGLFAGTFLSWPVAVLTTIAFFVFGEVAFSYLAEFALIAQQERGGGPFESLLRLLSHQNMVTVMAPTPAVVVAKTADAIVLPVMSRLVYLVPNFGALDVTNTVAEGFAVSWSQIRDLLLMGLGYTLPFSIAGYFILKNREVAA